MLESDVRWSRSAEILNERLASRLSRYLPSVACLLRAHNHSYGEQANS
jgi:hypothetical protein